MTSADVIVLRYKLHVDSVDSPIIQDSDESGQPFVTTTAEVFPGFGEGLQKMQAGGRYLLWLPPGTHARGRCRPSAFLADRHIGVRDRGAADRPGMAERRQMQQMQRLQQMMQQRAPPEGAEGAPPAESPGRGRGGGN